MAPIIISDISEKENWGFVGSEQTGNILFF
jgi:hypothetical protein